MVPIIIHPNLDDPSLVFFASEIKKQNKQQTSFVVGLYGTVIVIAAIVVIVILLHAPQGPSPR
jgi:hypothetical protein